jgi:hypothetical protein
MTSPVDDPYLSERIRTALAHDARVNELGLQVTLVGPRVFVTGTVASEERRSGVTIVIAELFPELELHNDVAVQQVGSAPPRESLS